MKHKLSFRIIICITIINALILCVSCKYVDDTFLQKQKVAVDSVKKLEYLSQTKAQDNDTTLDNIDSLTVIFDENGKAVEQVYDNSTDVINDKPQNDASSNLNNNTIQKETSVKIETKNNTTKKAFQTKNTPTTNKKTNQIKTTIKNENSETDAERDYRLQKSNHAIPDL